MNWKEPWLSRLLPASRVFLVRPQRLEKEEVEEQVDSETRSGIPAKVGRKRLSTRRTEPRAASMNLTPQPSDHCESVSTTFSHFKPGSR